MPFGGPAGALPRPMVLRGSNAHTRAARRSGCVQGRSSSAGKIRRRRQGGCTKAAACRICGTLGRQAGGATPCEPHRVSRNRIGIKGRWSAPGQVVAERSAPRASVPPTTCSCSKKETGRALFYGFAADLPFFPRRLARQFLVITEVTRTPRVPFSRRPLKMQVRALNSPTPTIGPPNGLLTFPKLPFNFGKAEVQYAPVWEGCKPCTHLFLQTFWSPGLVRLEPFPGPRAARTTLGGASGPPRTKCSLGGCKAM